MQDESRYAVGIDIGTDNVRAVVGLFEPDKKPTIVGFSETTNSGMRKGTIVDVNKVANAVDSALATLDKMSGFNITSAAVSIGGSHIQGFASRGTVTVSGHEITPNDIERVHSSATDVQIPANREILDITPSSYDLDGQKGIKDPLGLTGVRLEVDAYIITAMIPHLRNIDQVLEVNQMVSYAILPSSIASAQAVLTDKQRENGVVLIDLGGTTTDIAVYEDGDLVYTAVLPVGSNNITNDLAIGLKTDLDVAEKVKIEYAVAMSKLRQGSGTIRFKVGNEMVSFPSEIVDEIVEARVEHTFELVNNELRKIKKYANLPGGIVLTGGGARLKGIASSAKEYMQLAARVGKPHEYGGLGDKVVGPEWATAIGLMKIDFDGNAQKVKAVSGNKKGLFGGLFKKKNK